jgi:hypothetical protein
MTQNDFTRAQLAAFCIREAGPDAPVEHMKAIALCMRNRVRQGWHGGEWLENIDQAGQYAAHSPGLRVYLDMKNRSQSRLVREIDEIFFSRPSDEWSAESAGESISLEESVRKSVYWAFTNRAFTDWFKSQILYKAEEHRQGTQIGLMMLFE